MGYSAMVCSTLGSEYEHGILYKVSTTPGLKKFLDLFYLPPVGIQIIFILNNLCIPL